MPDGFWGTLTGRPVVRAAFLAAALAVPLAGGLGIADAGAQVTDQESRAAYAITNTTLAYLKTGNPSLDRMSEAGLYGLGKALQKKTALENIEITRGNGGPDTNRIINVQVMPMGVDAAKDDLSLYSFIYWPIDPAAQPLTRQEIQNLNEYMRRGGFLFIDTRDQATLNSGREWLQQAVRNGLNIPPLKKVEGCEKVESDCHTLGKTFYLLQQFPGRYAGGGLWAEKAEEYRQDGVASVVVGGNEWAAAWAIDKNNDDKFMYPVIGDDPKQREHAYRVGINTIMYVFTGSYKQEQFEVPAILDKIKKQP